MIDEQLWRDIKRVMPVRRPPYLPRMVGTIEGFDVMLVDGNKVKLRERKSAKSSHLGEPDFMDFVEGGNGYEDWELCCKNEVLIDAMLDPVCWGFIAYHELHEARDMKKGMSYEKAHEQANAGEKLLRQREKDHAA